MTKEQRIELMNIFETLSAETTCGNCSLCDECRSQPGCIFDKMHDMIEELDTIDAVPVVRCKDCQYRDADIPFLHLPKVSMNHSLSLHVRAEYSILAMISSAKKANERTVILMARYVDMDACPCNKCKHMMSGNCLPQYQACQNYEEWYEGVDLVPGVLCKDCNLHMPAYTNGEMSETEIYCPFLDIRKPNDWHCGDGLRERKDAETQ